ncbi:fibronectin type III domain-containing protein [Stenotrophomonas pictorum]|uniref:fibronectin type III domain-containing protein n=1 Tax=Stenotrophomonas pictorum TaxID=86184 RepID=UPI0006D1B4BD
MPFLRRFLILAFALFPLLVVASAQAAITARVTYQTHAAYLANGNPAPGTLVFLRSPADGDQNNAVGVAWQELNGNVSNLPVNLGNTPGWFRVVYNDSGAYQAIGCTTSPLSHSNFQYLADGQSIDITITCTMPPPNVTDARISIAGATGNGGVFRRGDTVTASWNNTASGDNNAGITGVTVDFSQFGGGAAVAATNNAGTWTAFWAVAAGITASNRNVSITASNSTGSTTRADTSNATVDSVVPTVVSIAPASGASASNTTVNFTASFSEGVTGVSTDDFTLVGTGSATGSIASASGSGSSYTVTVNGITGNGTLKLNLNASTNISDTAGNSGLAAFTAGTTHTVAIATAPGAPTIGTATAGDAQASVTFTAPASNGGSAITGYTVTSNPGGITAGGNGFTTSPITLSGLSNGTAYTFTVTATNAVGTSTASAASNSVTPKANQTITFTNPGAQNFGTTPTLTATASSSLPVSFSSATTGVCTITSGGSLTFITAGSCTINADQAGNAATNAATTISQSFLVNAVAPGAPVIGTATAGNTQASVSFSAPANTGGSSITGYTVTANPGGATASGAASPLLVSGLSNGQAYTFTVTASNVAGTGPASAASNAVTPAAPQVITFANPGAQNFGTTPTLTASADSNLPVSFSSATTAVCTITSGGSLTFITAGNCTINADQAGNAAWLAASQVSRSFTVNPVVPGAPTIGTATGGDTQASVSFSAPANTGGSSITGYTVTANPGGATASGAASPLLVSGLSNGQAYTFTVTASNVAGTGPASAASNAVTPAAPQVITFTNPGAQNFGTTPTLTASADSNLPVSFSSATPAVCTITSGGLLGFASTGSCTIHADQPGNASYLPAPRVSRTFSVNGVVPGAPTIGTATVAGASAVSVGFSAPLFDGGAAITGYTVISSPGGFTATGAGSPITVTGLTPGTSYTFVVTATNANGTGAASAPSNAVTPVPPLAVAPVSATVAYGTASPISLAITGAASSVAVATAPAHGTAVASGTTITYTPAPGHAGSDSFSYTASDAYTTTAAATVSITVSAPTVVIDTASLAVATADSAYTQILSSSGGASPYRYALSSGTLPAGLSLSASGTLSGTPTATGTFAFDVTSTDSSTGTGPFSATRSYSLQVDAPLLAVAPVSATIGYGAGPSPVSLAITGVASSVTVVSAPAHGSAVASGTTITYTPAPGHAGPDSFSYTASDAYTTTAPATVSITVSAPSLSLTTSTLPAATGSAAYAQTLAASGGSAPYRYAVSSGALPPGLVLASDGSLGGTPTLAGSFAFAITVTDSSTGTGPFTATQGYVLVVGAPVLTVDPLPVATGGQAYRVQLSAQGGAAPYAFSVGAARCHRGWCCRPAAKSAAFRPPPAATSSRCRSPMPMASPRPRRSPRWSMPAAS